MVRPYYISEALMSFRRLGRVMHEMTHEEVIACLDLEAGTQRRQSLTDKLINRAVQLESQSSLKRLSEKYHHGTST